MAKKLKATYSPLTVSTFPDGDIYLKYDTNLKGKTLVLVQSFQPNPEHSLSVVLFAGKNAQDLGAKKVILIAPYLAYMRQDARFNPGEAVSSKIVGEMLSEAVDKVYTFDPHIHRYKSLSDIFSIPAKYLTANWLIADYIKKHFKDIVIVGPDRESSQWAKRIADKIGVPSTVCKKKRLTSWKVKVKIVNPVLMKGKNVVIVDDIISTGHTIVEAAKEIKKHHPKSISAICVHGLFVGEALKKLKRAGVSKVISTNCIEHRTNGIDVSSLLLTELKKEK